MGNAAALALLVLGAIVALANLGCVVQNWRLRRKGEDRHVSTIPLLGMAFVLLAFAAQWLSDEPLLSGWMFVAVGLADVSTLVLLCLPIYLIRLRLKAENEG